MCCFLGFEMSEMAFLCCLFASRGRVSPRRASYFLLLRQKKVAKEKATLLSASLRFATGNLRCSRFAGSRRTRFAQTAASPDPRNAPLLGAARRAWGSGTERAIAALGLLAVEGAVRLQPPRAERSDGSVVFLSHPSGCAEERSVSRTRAHPCLSEASLGGTPRNVSAAGCPVAKRRGRRQWGRLFFAYFLLAKQKKVSPLPGGFPGLGKQALSKRQKGARP
jgi:hypothetical protein